MINMSNTVTTFRPLRAVRISSDRSEDLEPKEPALSQALLEEARQEGYEAGKREAESALEETMQQLAQFGSQTLQNLQNQQESLISEVEHALPELVLEGVRRIIETWTPQPEEIENLVNDLLTCLEGDAGPVRVFLNPEDRKIMESIHENMERDFPGVTLFEDSKLRSGECYARGRFGTTDGRFEAKLENMRKVFL